MEEEHPEKEAPDALEKETDQPVSSNSAEETVIQEQTDSNTTEAEAEPRKRTGLIIAGVAIVVLLILVGLLLPPISLGERLGIGGSDSAALQEETAPDEEISSAEGINVSLDSGDTAKTKQLDQNEFMSQQVGEDWAAAAAALPSNLTLVSDVFEIDYRGSEPVGSAVVAIPASAQPYQTLDLYGWDGQQWSFIPSEVGETGNSLNSASGTMPLALALMQTAKPDAPIISAEILPAQELPVAITPFLNEVSAGTLTLGQDGELLGEIVSVPQGGYRQYLRATNTGVIVDTTSLTSLLSSAEAMENNIQELVEQASSGGFAGVNLDYQGPDPGQRDAFSSYVSNLAQAVHEQGLELIVTLESPVLENESWDTAGQDWQVIGEVADVVYAQMPLNPTAYGDNGEAQQILEWATRQIDRQKLSALVTVNAIDSVGDVRREVEADKALTNFGELQFVKGDIEVEPGESIEVALSGTAGDLEWDPESLTYRYSYEQAGQSHDVWLSSEAVLSHQGRLPNRLHVRGLAVRGLGQLAAGDGFALAIENYLEEGESPQPESAAIVWVVEDETGGVVASDTGSNMAFEWEGSELPGTFIVRADFAQGDSVANLGIVEVLVSEGEEPTPTPEPEEEEQVAEEETEATPEATSVAQAVSVDPGDADAVANTPANVRKGPGLAYGIVGGVQTGETVSLTGRNDDRSWYQIQMSDGADGWIFAQLLTLNSNLDAGSLAVIEVEPPVVASSGDGGGGAGAPPPVIAPAGGGSFELGGQTHTLANPTMMQMAGMNWVKFQHKWGPGDSADAVAGRIQQAHGNGFKVLLSIPGANAYPSSIDFSSYVEFLRGVAALGPDAIEVWNEENIDFEWPAGQIDPASYVNNMLAPAYNAIKSANPSVMVIMGAPAPTGFDNGTNAWSDQRYMAGVAAAGGANYMDCIGVHHNAGATSPNSASGHPAGNNHYSWYFGPTLNMYYNAFGGSRPVCFTELGYLSGQDFGGVPSRFSWASNTTVAQHAQWLAEAASLSANSGRVRMMIVFNVDFTHWGDDPQAGFAMLRPDGSCPSCGLLGQVMGR
jgi:hypothetical protein